MTIAIDKMMSELAVKMLRGEDISDDIAKAFASLSPIEKRMLAVEGLTHAIEAVAQDDPDMEIFQNGDGKTCIRRAA
ncbi:hypothetical protein WMC41_16155 [Shinella yambaruensis]|uniref:hypothetical protein n=1 Tax=Shinella yambaruensis TaxID=415996 RepID=UPI003D7BB1F2